MHDNSSHTDQLKSLRDGLNLSQPPVSQQKRELQPSFSFEDTLKNVIDFGQDEPMKEEIYNQDVTDLLQDDGQLADESRQITLYDDDLIEPKVVKSLLSFK